MGTYQKGNPSYNLKDIEKDCLVLKEETLFSMREFFSIPIPYLFKVSCKNQQQDVKAKQRKEWYGLVQVEIEEFLMVFPGQRPVQTGFFRIGLKTLYITFNLLFF
jgi:hypothetical protein